MILAWDSETYPITPGLQAPPVVCGQWRETPDGPTRVALAEEALDRLEAALRGSETIAGHNLPYDLACAAATRPRMLWSIFQAGDEDRLVCTLAREKLLRVALGAPMSTLKWGLVPTLDRHKVAHAFKAEDKSSASWRTRYHLLRDVPVDAWPEDARRYAHEDVRHLHALVVAQDERAARTGLPDLFLDAARQTRAAIWLYLSTCTGIRTDPRAVRVLRDVLEAEYQDLRSRLSTPVGWGPELLAIGTAPLVRPSGAKRGTRDNNAAKERMVHACLAAQLPIPVTKTGKARAETGEFDLEAFQAGAVTPATLKWVSLEADACKVVSDPILREFARFGSIRSNLLPRVDRLDRAGSLPIQFSFDTIKATGRTSCRAGTVDPGDEILAFGDQGQNLNQEPGVRECYVARPGHVFISVDWSAAELHTLAEVCINLGLDSVLARELNSGRDVHLSFGSSLFGFAYEWAKEHKSDPRFRDQIKDARKMGKVGNFGLPGGLGALKLRLWAAKVYEVFLSQPEAERLKKGWLAFFTEMADYFAFINELVSSGRPLRQLFSGRYRGDIRYTSACNSYFQGLAADMAKATGWELTRECYLGGGPLWGCRIPDFIHDEFLIEAPEHKAHEVAVHAAERCATLGSRWTPHVPVRAEAAISRHWRKAAEPTWRDGVLIPWEDRDPTPEDLTKAAQLAADGWSATRISWSLGFEPERVQEWTSAPL